MALKDYFFSFEPSQSLVCLICGFTSQSTTNLGHVEMVS